VGEFFDDLASQILASNPKVDRNTLLSMVERKKQESHGLLSDEGAIRLVAQQLSVMPLSSIGLKDQRIKSVHTGLNDATITGIIVSLSDPRQFERSDGSFGKVLRVRLTDGSGELSCVFWDSQADVVIREMLVPGCQIRVLHGYTKNGTGGEVELHLGTKSSFQILSRRTVSETVTNIDRDKLQRSDRLKLRMISVQKSRSENGPTWALCQGDIGMMIAKFWDEHAENVLAFQLGCELEVTSPSIDERNGLLYVNVGSKSTINKLDSEPDSTCNPVNIVSLKPSPLLWTITGKLVSREETREVQTREGRKTKVSSLGLDDGSGKIRVSCWEQQADKTENLRIGDSISLKGIRIRQNMNGENEASTVFLTSIEKQQ
jgi:hypothetical protein